MGGGGGDQLAVGGGEGQTVAHTKLSALVDSMWKHDFTGWSGISETTGSVGAGWLGCGWRLVAPDS